MNGTKWNTTFQMDRFRIEFSFFREHFEIYKRFSHFIEFYMWTLFEKWYRCIQAVYLFRMETIIGFHFQFSRIDISNVKYVDDKRIARNWPYMKMSIIQNCVCVPVHVNFGRQCRFAIFFFKIYVLNKWSSKQIGTNGMYARMNMQMLSSSSKWQKMPSFSYHFQCLLRFASSFR